MKPIWKLIVAASVLFALAQLVRPGIPTKTATAEVQVPPAVRQVLEKSCYSCHSDERRLSWFDEIEPGYWIVRRDILTGRSHLDFSTVGSAPAAVQKAKLYESVSMIQLGAMPLAQFTALHPEAKVTADDLAVLKAYLSPWPAPPSPPSTAMMTGAAESPASLSSIQPEQNGFPFDPSFESWKVLSTTDRGDNNTFRFVLGNDVAVKAAQAGNISPWPDGTRFAKIAWQQETGADGLIHPGKFVQVELMVKGAEQYQHTDGWGWGRWLGLNLKPYGKDARFVNECTGCHMPVRGDDSVYTLPITPAHLDRSEGVNNAAASLSASLPWQPLGWGPITMYVDPKTHTTATLYGNDAAMEAVHARGDAANAHPAYPSGAVLALVTWAQRDDPHWFGARIPDAPRSVEFVQTSSDVRANAYRLFEGAALTESHPGGKSALERTSFILGLSPARLP